VRKLKIVTEEIQNENADTEKQKITALKLSENFSNKDISEVNSYTVVTENVGLCMKLIVLLFDEEKEIKNKDKDD